VTLYESHLLEVTGLGGAATESMVVVETDFPNTRTPTDIRQTQVLLLPWVLCCDCRTFVAF
jgi:hypothetical protein